MTTKYVYTPIHLTGALGVCPIPSSPIGVIHAIHTGGLFATIYIMYVSNMRLYIKREYRCMSKQLGVRLFGSLVEYYDLATSKYKMCVLRKFAPGWVPTLS